MQGEEVRRGARQDQGSAGGGRRRPRTTSTSSTTCWPSSYIKTNDLPGGRQGDRGGDRRRLDRRGRSAAEASRRWRRSTTSSRTTTRRSSSATAPSRAASPTRSIKTIVGQSYYLKGDYKGDAEVRGRPDRPARSRRARRPRTSSCSCCCSACLKANDDACTEKALEKLVDLLPEAGVLGAAAVHRAPPGLGQRGQHCCRPTA